MALRDWFWIILLGGIWGSSFFFNDILIRELDPLWVSGGRVGVGAIASWGVVFALKKHVPRDWKLLSQLGLLGILAYTAPFALFPLAQADLASGVAAIINAMTPITTVIVSQFWPGGERATPLKSVGIVAGFIGVAILASPALMGGGTSQLWAIGACLLATLCYATSLNLTRSYKHVDPTVMAAVALSGGAIAGCIMAFGVHGTPYLVTLEGWGALLGIGILATAFTFQVMYRILPRVGATNFTITTFIAPVSSIILGYLFLNESLKLEHFLGMVGIFIGLSLIDGRLFKIKKKARQ